MIEKITACNRIQMKANERFGRVRSNARQLCHISYHIQLAAQEYFTMEKWKNTAKGKFCQNSILKSIDLCNFREVG